MQRGAINGIPVWIKLVALSGGERTVIKEAPSVDGAVVEVQGQKPLQYRCEFSLIQDGQWITDDYETASLSLRAMFLEGGPFTVSLPVTGELTGLWMQDTYSLTFFDDQRQLISEGAVTFTEARPFPILQESAAANIESSVAALSESAVINFGDRVPPQGLSENPIDVLNAGALWLQQTQGVIGSAFEPVNAFAGSVDTLVTRTEQLLGTPQNYASFFMSTARGLISLVPSLSAQGDTQTGSAAIQDSGNDKPSVTFGSILDLGTNFDAEVPTPQGEIVDPPSEEDLAELDESASARSMVLTSVVMGVSLAVIETNFATVQSVLSTAEALEPAYERLFALENLDYRVYNNARRLRASTQQFLSETAAGLPRLRLYTAPKDTDVFDVLPDLYDLLEGIDEVQAAVDSILDLNTIADPLSIKKGTPLNYLDPLT